MHNYCLFEVFNFINMSYTAAGLDASSAHALITHLVKLAGKSESSDGCKRAIILTIHQPGLQIFQMFDRLLLLSEGKVHYLQLQNCIRNILLANH